MPFAPSSVLLCVYTEENLHQNITAVPSITRETTYQRWYGSLRKFAALLFLTNSKLAYELFCRRAAEQCTSCVDVHSHKTEYGCAAVFWGPSSNRTLQPRQNNTTVVFVESSNGPWITVYKSGLSGIFVRQKTKKDLPRSDSSLFADPVPRVTSRPTSVLHLKTIPS